MKIPLAACFILSIALVSACKEQRQESVSAETPAPVSLFEARRGFSTNLVSKAAEGEAAIQPPKGVLRLVHYPAPLGKLAAYVGVAPADHHRTPAIIWLVGGFRSSISDVAWDRAPLSNDQSASAFREAGIVMMYPSLRGGNDNPGFHEAFFGEVDDVLAAAAYLHTLDYVDPERIYLGGHSTGGTLALLAAECGAKFRAIFAFGPVGDVVSYGKDVLPFDVSNPKERRLRAPILWLTAIETPTFVIEGATGHSNIASLRVLAAAPHSKTTVFLSVAGADHFSTLAPITRLLAKKIVADTGPALNIALDEAELSSAVANISKSGSAGAE